jgi:hypothetical protein
MNGYCFYAEAIYDGSDPFFSFSVLGLIFDFDFWCLMPLSAIFQLYHGDQF